MIYVYSAADFKWERFESTSIAATDVVFVERTRL